MVRKIGIYNVSQITSSVVKQKESEEVPPGPATFEEAISATGFGKFNYLLMFLGALPANWTVMVALSNIAQIIPAVKCDFNLNLTQIGILQASPFMGNIVSPFLFGYLADTKGRRKLMIYTTLADGICNILSAFSVNMQMLTILKFITGFLTSAPSGIIMSYLSECHATKYRSNIILCSGIIMGCANLVLPLVAWAILPRNFYFAHSWQVYLLICALPSLVTALSFTAFPESPKFLMSIGKHDEALIVFQKIYALNTGKLAASYPIMKLLCENKQTQISPISQKKPLYQTFTDGLKQFKPLFHKPYLYRLVLSITIQFFLLLGVNTLRIWLPEIVTMMDQYSSNNNNTDASLCRIISDSLNKSEVENLPNSTIIEKSCNSLATDDVYIKLSLIGTASIVMYIIVIFLTSIIDKKIILALLLIISGLCGIALIWCENPTIILLISALYTTQTGVALVTFISIIVDLFPTSFRTLTVLIASTAGRIGSIIGNILFPILLVIGCAPPFIYLGGSVLVCIIPLILISTQKPEDS